MITALVIFAMAAGGTGSPTISRPTDHTTERVTHERDAAAAWAARAHVVDGVRRTPTFARQMKLSCNVCHMAGFPQLTRFGRLFKLNGYTLSGLSQIVEQIDSLSRRSLELSPIPGLSMAAIIDATSLNTPPRGTAKTTADFPQQLSLFFGGEIAPRLGGLAQLTYSDQTGRIGIDNTDIRFASHLSLRNRDVLFGVTLHNNPTVQDVWNTAPAWSYPFVSATAGPRPMASTLIDGGLAQSVLGLGGYALYDNLIYAELSGYTSAPQGPRISADSGATNTLRDVAPYWRVALQNRQGPSYLMIGAFGLSANLYPTGLTGLTNHYADVGVDAQADRPFGQRRVILRGSWIHERQTLAASINALPATADNGVNTLSSFRASATFAPNDLSSFTLGYFSTTGSSDARLYAPGETTGSRTGRPDTEGTTGEVTLSPWLNVRIGLQYTMYQRFNGASSAYDVTNGRAARNNNTLMLYTWFAF